MKKIDERCHQWTISGVMRALSRIAFSLAILLAGARAHGAVAFFDDADRNVAIFTDSGEIYLKGSLTTGYRSNLLPYGKKWFIRDDSGNVILLLALQDQLVLPGGGVMNAGDLKIRGSVQLTQAGIPASSNVCTIAGAGGALVSAISKEAGSSGNLLVKTSNGQTRDDVIHERTALGEIFSATVVSNPFIFHPADLANVTNRGQAYDINGAPITNPSPPTGPEPNYRYAFSMVGIGDLVQTTWARDEQGKPVIYFAGTDGYGISFVPGDGYETFDYPNPFLHTYPRSIGGFNYARDIQPGITVSKLTGKPGTVKGLAIKYANHVMAPDSCGKTISRFLWRAQAQNFANGEWSGVVNPDKSPFTESDFLNCNTHMMDGELNASGLLYLDNALYMTLSAYSGFENRNDLSNTMQKDVWGVYMFKSVDETINGRHHDVGEIWHPLVHRENASELWHLSMYDRGEDGQSLPRAGSEGYEPPCRIFDHGKLAYPFFIQFGRGYEDYRDAFPQGPRYVYMMSGPKRMIHPQSEMYLARALAEPAGNIMKADAWSFYAGIDRAGTPLWTRDKDKATAVIYSPGELGPASAMYHKPSGRYLLSTWGNSDKETWDGRKDPGIMLGSDKEPYGSRHENRWFLWEAPNPWGPWRKILSNDFNGRQNDITGLNPAIGTGDNLGKLFGFSGYNVALIPAWMENDANGGWTIWGMQAGFAKLLNIEAFIKYFFMYPWLEYFASYTQEFMKISLNPLPRPLDSQSSAMCEVQQNAWKNSTPGSGSKTYGYFFTLSRDLNITHLGRYYDTGNSGTHRLAIYQVALDNDADPTLATLPAPAAQPLAAVAVAMAHHSPQMDGHGFIYSKLDSPVLLKARDATPEHKTINYVLVSEEQGGGDKFYGEYSTDAERAQEMDLADVRTGNSVTVRKAAQYRGRDAANRDQWDLCLYRDGRPYPGNSFGPLNFLFDSAPERMATGQALPPCRIERDWLAGCTFTVDHGSTMVVTQLGRYRGPGNTEKHEVRLMRAADPLVAGLTALISPIRRPWYAGCKFTVPPGRQIGISQLGRYKLRGNAGVHRLMLIRLYDDGTTGTVAQTDLDLGKFPAAQQGMCYQSLPAMAPLVAGNYCLVSQESGGASADSFYGHASDPSATPQLEITAPYDASITNLTAGYFSGNDQGGFSGAWQDTSWANRCYGPVGLVFQEVTVASVVVDTNVAGERMIYQPLARPVRLTPGNYHLVSREFSGAGRSDKFYGHFVSEALTPLLLGRHPLISNLKAGYFPCDNATGAITGAWTDMGWQDRCYGPVGLKFE